MADETTQPGGPTPDSPALPAANAAIPMPPDELWTWLLDVLRSLFADCPADDEKFHGRILRFGLFDQMRLRRGLEEKFSAAGKLDDWRKNERHYIRSLKADAALMSTDDVRWLRKKMVG
jgi:hypothetical protein